METNLLFLISIEMFFLLSKQEGTRAEGREMLPLLSFQSDLQATLTSQASPSYFSEL